MLVKLNPNSPCSDTNMAPVYPMEEFFLQRPLLGNSTFVPLPWDLLRSEPAIELLQVPMDPHGSRLEGWSWKGDWNSVDAVAAEPAAFSVLIYPCPNPISNLFHPPLASLPPPVYMDLCWQASEVGLSLTAYGSAQAAHSGMSPFVAVSKCYMSLV